MKFLKLKRNLLSLQYLKYSLSYRIYRYALSEIRDKAFLDLNLLLYANVGDVPMDSLIANIKERKKASASNGAEIHKLSYFVWTINILHRFWQYFSSEISHETMLTSLSDKNVNERKLLEYRVVILNGNWYQEELKASAEF